MKKARVLALIPARGGSKRLPGKNLRLLDGAPLVEWTFAAACAAQRIDRVILSSDDSALLGCAANWPRIALLERPAALSSDTATSVDVALHALEEEAGRGRDWEVLVLLQPTSPLRARGRIDEGVDLLTRDARLDSVVGVAPAPVSPFHCYLQNKQGLLDPITGDPASRAVRSQDFPTPFILTGSFYAVRSEVLRSQRRFVTEATAPLVCCEPGETIDIDTAEDFAEAEDAVRGGGPWVAP